MKTTAIVPASPGYFVLYSQDNGGITIGAEVLAWAVVYETPEGGDPSALTEGITLDGAAENAGNFYGYLCPDKSVTIPCVQDFPNMDDAMADWKRKRERVAASQVCPPST